MEINPDKSRIVYCQDKNRRAKHEVVSFNFLGFTFRPRRCVDRSGNVYPNFLPAVSQAARKEINRTIRSWHIQLQNDKTLEDLARMVNPILCGWLNYYGHFYPSELRQIWRNVNRYLVRWVRRKYKRFSNHKRRARRYLDQIARANSHLFVPWALGVFPSGLSDRSRMS